MTEMIRAEAGSTQVPSFHAVALSAGEMQTAQADVKLYLERSAAETSNELRELRDSMKAAELAGWETGAINRAIVRIKRRQRYLANLLMAVGNGYAIVPNMPMTYFAVRVKRSKPKFQSATEKLSRWADNAISDEEPQLLEPGEGHYVNPVQGVDRSTFEIEEGGKQVTRHMTETARYNPIEFPFAAAHSVVMDATQRAMALKIFDRIGIVPEARPKGDPLIIGQILQGTGPTRRVVSCLIAWHLDLRTL